jgi:hypothetical protein
VSLREQEPSQQGVPGKPQSVHEPLTQMNGALQVSPAQHGAPSVMPHSWQVPPTHNIPPVQVSPGQHAPPGVTPHSWQVPATQASPPVQVSPGQHAAPGMTPHSWQVPPTHDPTLQVSPVQHGLAGKPHDGPATETRACNTTPPSSSAISRARMSGVTDRIMGSTGAVVISRARAAFNTDRRR